MRKLILAGVAAVALGGIAAESAVQLAWAQPAPGGTAPGGPAIAEMHPNGEAPMAMPMPGPPPAPPWMHGMHGGPHGPMGGPRMFGLFFHPADRQLTAPEVQKIAEAFLLWNGNRDWKVTQVVAGPDGRIGFAFATTDGGVIARFTMDSKTGRIARIG